MNSSFSTYHPIVSFTYFTLVLVFSMFFTHPVCLAISLITAFLWSVYLGGKKALKFNLLYMIPTTVITALINPAFNHEGVTILTYLPSGNPLTLESITYGISAATMLVTIICWFSCYNAIMTSDKFVYLFGRIIPAMSLIFSMVLRFVPKFKAQLKVVSNAQKCVGRDVSNGTIIQRARYGIHILSIMITWALENSIETADSMKSRGYGLPGRTAFSIYRFDERDKNALTLIITTAIYIMIAAFHGDLYWRYFPYMKGSEFSIWVITAFMAYFMLCVLPLIIDKLEDRKWKRIKLNI